MKIFLREKTIVLSDHPQSSNSKKDFTVAFHSKKQLKKVFQNFDKNEKGTNLIIYSEPPKTNTQQDIDYDQPLLPDKPGKNLISSFLSLFKIIEAAGGFVKNQRGEYLFIFRRGKWDLPKGKIIVCRAGSEEAKGWQTDKGSLGLPAGGDKAKAKIKEPYDKAAMREVMEETGLYDIRIIRELPRTFHIYMQHRKWILKPTTWFEMYAPDNQTLIPEEKEDISEVRWFTFDEMRIIKENTYPSIRELLSNYELQMNSDQEGDF